MSSCKARFLDNNFAENNISAATYSSQQAAFPFTNAVSRSRKQVWVPSGCFEVTSSTGKTIYFNDGTDKNADLTNGIYTGTTLAAHVQTVLNTSSSGWTVSYSTTTYRFTVTNSNAAYYIRVVENNANLTPNDIVNGANDGWGIMGFLSSTGTANLLVPAIGVAVKHSTEYFILDLGTNLPVDNICLIGPVDEIFGLSDSACVCIAANNINNFTNTVVDDTIRITNDTLSSKVEGYDATPITIYDNGIYIDLSQYTSDTSYRFWKISLIDRYNTDTTFKLAHCYVGDYTELSNRNLSIGFNWDVEDTTETFESEDGTRYFDTKPIQETISGIQFNLVNEANRQLLMNMFKQLGRSNPFYFQLDPQENISAINELTKFCYFENAPGYNHVIHDYFNVSMSVKEII